MHADPSLDGMGTTLIAMLRAGDKIVLAHIGDSRGVHGARRRRHADHQGPLVRAEPRRRGADHPRRGADPPAALAGHPGAHRRRRRRARPRRAPGPHRRPLRHLLRRPDRLRRARHHPRGAHGHGRPRRDRRPAGRPRPAGRGARQRHRRGGRPRRHRQPAAHPAPGRRRRRRPPAPAPGRSRPPRPPRPRRSPRRPPAAPTPTTGSPSPRRGRAPGGSPCCAWPRCSSCSSSSWPAARTPCTRGRQRQYYLAAQDGVVAVYRGVEQNLGPISLSNPEYATTIAIDDLPSSYQDSLSRASRSTTARRPTRRVAELRLQAQACRWAQLNGEVCRTVPSTWTIPTPTPSPSTSPTPPRRRAHAGRHPERRRPPSSPASAPTSSPVTS